MANQAALHELEAAEAAALIARGGLSALDYARALLSLKEEVEPRISALAHFDRDAFLASAKRADSLAREARSRGTPPPPLLGIPIGVKDTIDTARVPTRCGSALHAGRIPSEDAACLSPLWRAGGYLHSKTVTTELAYFDPGPTRNPWNLAHTPGGSSSGSAAGVAAGLFPLALGSQTAGSVIRPAAYCGVVGFVPTQGRLPLAGVLSFARTVDQLGLFARSVKDVALLFEAYGEAAAGPRAAGEKSPRGWPGPEPGRAPFLGIAREYFVEHSEEEVGHRTIHQAKQLASEGAIVHVVHLPASFADIHHSHRLLMQVELARSERDSFQRNPSLYGKKVAELIRAGLSTSPAAYQEALAHRERFRAEVGTLLGEIDALLLPAVPSAAPYGLESTGDPRFSIPWTCAGLPAITLPLGLNPQGLPLAIQLVGAAGSDRHLLQVAAYVEERLQWGHRAAPISRNGAGERK
jgi:Asp-tRNA(Asn)/Glu-tRNA(Gln) amidotransferase A subunit family amidase